MRIKEIMSHPLVTVPTHATLDEAARVMWEFDCGIVPVIRDDGRLAGVITDRDICMAAYTQGQPLASIPVTTAMASDVVACHETDDVARIERLMGDNQIRRIPVLDVDNRPVGIVAMNDLARLAATTRKAALDRDLVKTMAAVCQPRADVAAARPNNVVAFG